MVVTDLMMPKMTGDELARRLRLASPGVKVLYLTGFSDRLFKEKVTLWADEAFLEKPCSVKGLLQACRCCCSDISSCRRKNNPRPLSDKATRMATNDAVGLLAGGIAHDFDALLDAIVGHADALTDCLSAGDPRSAQVAAIRQAAEQAAMLTQRLLASSGTQPRQLAAESEPDHRPSATDAAAAGRTGDPPRDAGGRRPVGRLRRSRADGAPASPSGDERA
jgi:Response regulator containing CheY-like receiver domain and AraC-type DNA-binding domain